jgi:hypothetical protein
MRVALALCDEVERQATENPSKLRVPLSGSKLTGKREYRYGRGGDGRRRNDGGRCMTCSSLPRRASLQGTFPEPAGCKCERPPYSGVYLRALASEVSDGSDTVYRGPGTTARRGTPAPVVWATVERADETREISGDLVCGIDAPRAGEPTGCPFIRSRERGLKAALPRLATSGASCAG